MEKIESIKEYRDYIISILELPKRIDMCARHETDGKVSYARYIIGMISFIDIKVKIVEKYSRSFKVNIKFDKYEKDFIFFTPTTKSPTYLLKNFDHRLFWIVNNAIIEDENFGLLTDNKVWEPLSKKERFINSIKYYLKSIKSSATQLFR